MAASVDILDKREHLFELTLDPLGKSGLLEHLRHILVRNLKEKAQESHLLFQVSHSVMILARAYLL